MSHVGKMIKTVFDKQTKEHTASWLAEQLHCDRTNVYKIFHRKTIDTGVLMRISQILDHNFFLDLSAKFESSKKYK